MNRRVLKNRPIELYYIGDQHVKDELTIKRLPSFFDALQVSKCPNATPEYQKVPLNQNTSLTLNYHDHCQRKMISAVLNYHSRTIYVEEEQPSFSVLSCFIYKGGNSASVLVQRPDFSYIKKKKNQPPLVGKTD